MSTPNKLNNLDVKEIRRRRLLGASGQQLAVEYGVSAATISYHTRGINHRLIKLFGNRSAA